MAPRFRADINLDFSLQEASGEETRGSVKASGSEVVVALDRIDALQSQRLPSLGDLRPLAKTLSDQGLTVVVDGPDGRIISLGAVEAPASQRVITKSPHIKLGKLGALAPMLKRGRRSPAGGISLLPPGTLLPLLPTVKRRIPRRITTTHYTRGGGRPRLIFVQDSKSWNGQVPREFSLTAERVRIGSDESVDLQLPGLDGVHAEIVHNDRDEYVLVRHGKVTGSFGPGSTSVLRTGSRLQMGQWCLAFFREEFADHGRPFGGRSGGEFAYQRPQRDPRTGALEQDGSTYIR
ncbi:MAG: FHA domain-containing protein [Arthrobacter sp.]|nr:FHA domain-containing protein [Arthrobacter sp.]MDZ4352307.1 FHA domain-containing protein [Arthrobacter sp.]